MTTSNRHRTLNLKWPMGQVLLPAIILISVISIGSEVLARSETAESVLPPPTVDGHWEIGSKLMLLDRLAASGQYPDCFIIGSSQTYDGIDPDILAQTYQDRVNRPIRCFNFGLSGLNIQGTLRLARIVIQKYHPRLLVIGINFRDFQGGFSLDTPWSDYYLGDPSVLGWLEAQSVGYRYVNTYFTFPVDSLPTNPFASNGFVHMDESIDIAGTDFMTVQEFKNYSGFLSNFSIGPVWIEALARVAGLDSADVRVVFIELPLPARVYAALARGENARRQFVDAMSQTTAAAGVPFWQTQDVVHIPDDGWSNLFHLNARGAGVLSRWLGDQLAEWSADHPLRSRQSGSPGDSQDRAWHFCDLAAVRAAQFRGRQAGVTSAADQPAYHHRRPHRQLRGQGMATSALPQQPGLRGALQPEAQQVIRRGCRTPAAARRSTHPPT